MLTDIKKSRKLPLFFLVKVLRRKVDKEVKQRETTPCKTSNPSNLEKSVCL
jgi:hypothetical protein